MSTNELNQIDIYFANVDLNVIDQIQENISSTFLQDHENDKSEIIGRALPLIPVAVVAFLATLAAKVGWGIASQITADFYKWGATSACKKWNNVSVVKSFCKANGYLK